MRLQSPLEEKLNAASHALGVIFGVIGLVWLITTNTNTSTFSLLATVIYGCSFIVLFAASTLYHAIKDKTLKHYFRILDHISIYLLIAGTYTPVLLLVLQDSLGWPLLYTVWGIALFGVVLKLFFTGKLETFSTLLYLAMGWLIVFDFSTLSQRVAPNAINLLFAGGIAYTVGIVFYVFEKIPFNHVIWHCFVLAGAICHFFMILCYVIS
jgi:hemolysin III